MAGARAPLDGVRVIEVAGWVAAPCATALMADLGADVIKIEPHRGDPMRGVLRQALPRDGVEHVDYAYEAANRGKRSLAVALDLAEGQALVRQLIAGSDAFVTNMIPARQRRMGLDAERLLRETPSLIHASLTGYGTSGPDADRTAFDTSAFFARSGLASLIGEPDEPAPSFRPGQGDHVAGLNLLAAILAALRLRDATGEGTAVDVSLYQSGVWTIGCDMVVALVDQHQPSRRPRDEPITPLGERFRCADGKWLTLAAGPDQRVWPDLCGALDRADLAGDERFATPLGRYEHGREIMGALDEAFASFTRDEIGVRLDAVGIRWSPLSELPEVVADPQAWETGMFAEIDHPTAGRFHTLAAPFRIHNADVAVRGPAPRTGEHSEAVLTERGLSADEIAALVAAGVVT